MIGLLLGTAAAFNHIDECNGNPTRWVNLPSTWRLTKSGANPIYNGLSDADVINAFQAGFDVWRDTTTCCSAFTHVYGGTTGTGFNTNDAINTIQFAQTSWSPQFGSVNSVIAITVSPYYTSNCIIDSADELYNAVGFNFTVNNNPNFNQTDLQSIAAHEHGHWLGLDHSGVGQATMFASYSGGTGPRSLHPDDEAGVCDSHPGTNCGPVESDCTNGIDDDGDGLTDCADSDCAASGQCQCPVDQVVGCDATITGNTAGQGNGVQAWSCAGWETTGPERVYSFIPSADGVVTVTLSGLQADLDLFVTTELAGGCEPGNCLASGTEGTADEQVAFNGFGGVPYTVVVDGWDGASSAFTLQVDCPDPAPTGACDPVATLPCDATVQGSTYGFTNDVQAWSCAGWETTGAEAVYAITPAGSGPLTLDMYGLSSDLDLFVTTGAGGGCDPEACLAVSGAANAGSEQVVIDAVAGTTYYVIADGYAGAVSDFVLRSTCPPGGSVEPEPEPEPQPPGDTDAPPPLLREGALCGCQAGSGPAALWLPLLALAALGTRRRAR